MGIVKKQKKQKNADEKANRSILRLTYAVVFVFAALIGYLSYFLLVQREDVINSSYNARVDSLSERVVRGKIRSNDGTVLAETLAGADGQETRHYPYGMLFDHAAGYSSVGKTGVEALGNFYMLTSHTNLMEQILRELSGEKSLGDDVYTTLDVNLQQTAYEALGDRKGAVVVLEPDTGKILAMVSKPGYDPNTVGEQWDSLVGDGENARLLNRAAQGLYPPGSIFKIVTLLEYIRENPEEYADFRFDCDGIYEAGNYTIQCYHQTAHGSQNLAQVFANSCNGAFASIGQTLDKVQLTRLAEEFLYNRELPLAIAYSKSSFSLEDAAKPWLVSQTAIGQGLTQTTPMHSAMITAAIANGGILMKPYLIDHVENVGGETVKTFLPSAYGSLMTAEESKLLTELLRTVVTEGTGSQVNTEAYRVAGKTGSAEFETGKETHAWFTGFAPVDKPKLVVSVIVEEGGSGGKVAAPVARAIFDAYFSR